MWPFVLFSLGWSRRWTRDLDTGQACGAGKRLLCFSVQIQSLDALSELLSTLEHQVASIVPEAAPAKVVQLVGERDALSYSCQTLSLRGLQALSLSQTQNLVLGDADDRRTFTSHLCYQWVKLGAGLLLVGEEPKVPPALPQVLVHGVGSREFALEECQ